MEAAGSYRLYSVSQQKSNSDTTETHRYHVNVSPVVVQIPTNHTGRLICTPLVPQAEDVATPLSKRVLEVVTQDLEVVNKLTNTNMCIFNQWVLSISNDPEYVLVKDCGGNTRSASKLYFHKTNTYLMPEDPKDSCWA